jgi:hypothetical protein
MFPNNPVPAERLATFVNAWTKGVDGINYTPKGLAYSGMHAHSHAHAACVSKIAPCCWQQHQQKGSNWHAIRCALV